MAAIDNLFSIETNIITQLQTISGIKQIYLEAVIDGLNEDTTETPSLFIANKGLIAGLSVSQSSSQKLTTLWEVAVVCNKDDYKQVGGAKLIEVIKKLRGYQAADWIKPARVFTENRVSTEPEYQGNLMYYPLLFAIEIVI